ncbi:MAG: hypothetical protein V8S36_00430 [Lachnospiraceae bacterium]
MESILTRQCTEDSKLTTVITDAKGKAATDKYYYPKLHDSQKVWIREEYVPDDYVLDTEPRPYTWLPMDGSRRQ